MNLYQITISSKNKNSIKFFFLLFFKDKKLNFDIIKKYHQKTKNKKVLTILKSPHVNKKAQEQFETRFFYKQFTISSTKVFQYFIFLKKISTSLFSDIKIKIKVISSKKSNKKTEINIFNPDNFKTNRSHSLKKTKILLKIFDIYGELLIKNV